MGKGRAVRGTWAGGGWAEGVALLIRCGFEGGSGNNDSVSRIVGRKPPGR